MKSSVCAISCVLIIMCACVAHSANPVGYFEYVHPDDTEFAGGWAYDSDAPGQSLEIHFYTDNGVFLGSTTCNIYRSDVWGGGYYGFRWRIPYTIYDGGNHNIYAYAINVGSGSNVQIQNSPKAIHKGYALSNQDARVVVSLDCGGAITQIFHSSDFNTNMIYSHPGALVQGSLYDANSANWNYVQGSDRWHHYSGVVSWNYNSQTQTLYTKTRGLQWFPEYWGGGASTPVEGDLYLEQWTKLDGKKLYLTYKLTNISGAGHGAAYQEFPCLFVSGNYSTAVTMYNGNWQLQDYTGYTFGGTNYISYSTEGWFGASNSNGIGPSFIMKDNDPYNFYACNYSYQSSGAPQFGYMNTPVTFGIGNWIGATVTRDCCIYIGYYSEARAFALTY